jgi:NADPH:quinone reductase
MQAVALDAFGGVETLILQTLPVPSIGPDDVLIRVDVAGVGEWDPFEREGGYAEMLGIEPSFPYVLGSEGAGVVVAVGAQVDRFKPGDQVYAVGFLNPSGGFYAEYAALNADLVSFIPTTVTVEQAGVMGGVGTTALRGLDDTLRLQPDESILIFGASGGVGHLAVQLAKRMGARVLAVASGNDGVSLGEALGADAVIDGHTDDVLAATRRFAPNGLDRVLLTASGDVAEQAMLGVRDGGRVAYPYGIHPEPRLRPNVQLSGYYGSPDADIIKRFNGLIEAGPFEVHIARTFPLAQVAEAHRVLTSHYLGKLALRVR